MPARDLREEREGRHRSDPRRRLAVARVPEDLPDGEDPGPRSRRRDHRGVRGHQRAPRGELPEPAAPAEGAEAPRPGARHLALPRPLPRAAAPRALSAGDREGEGPEADRGETRGAEPPARPARGEALDGALRDRRRLHVGRLRSHPDLLLREPHAADARLEAFHRGPAEARRLVEPGPEAPGGREGAGRTAAGVDGANAAAAAVASPPLPGAPRARIRYWLHPRSAARRYRVQTAELRR